MNKFLYSIQKKITRGEKYRVVFYGDSVASAEWVHPNYQDIIEYVIKTSLSSSDSSWNFSWWNTNFINAALDGATTDDYLERVENDVLFYKPDLVFMFSNDNDVDKISETKHADNMKNLLAILTSNVENVIYSNSIKTLNDHQNTRYAMYDKETKKVLPSIENVTFVDMLSYFSKLDLSRFFTFDLHGKHSYLTDGKGGSFDAFHPNPLGNAYIAKYFLEQVFEINFDPEKYIADVEAGEKKPEVLKGNKKLGSSASQFRT